LIGVAIATIAIAAAILIPVLARIRMHQGM
jgi:hypothetical protein